jgi:hypothetical protein
MAKHVFYNGSVLLNAVDLSDHVDSVSFVVTLNDAPSAGLQEIEDYSMPGTRSVSDITLNMFQDFAASKTYATLSALWTARTIFNAVLKDDAGGNAPTNPQFTIPVFIKSFPIISAKRGDGHMSQLVLKPAGTMTIATS